jgi:hypothetical protein
MHVSAQPTSLKPYDMSTLLRGDAQALHGWLQGSGISKVNRDITVIILGAGCYGATMGWWRAPEQALFVAVKFPLIILLITLGNALLNSMLAPLLGLAITVRQSIHAVLMSFTISSAVLGAFAPLAAFMIWNAPPLTPDSTHALTYALIKLSHVMVIAFAGIVGCSRLFQLLASLANGDRAVARRVMFAWLAGNLFLGSQLCWLLRPFIGAPHLPVQFIRPEFALQGNFFENVVTSVLEFFR